VLHPSRLWEVLRYLRVALAANLAVHADGHRGRARGAFVEAEDDSALSHP
jgi:hypothetical protein